MKKFIRLNLDPIELQFFTDDSIAFYWNNGTWSLSDFMRAGDGFPDYIHAIYAHYVGPYGLFIEVADDEHINLYELA